MAVSFLVTIGGVPERHHLHLAKHVLHVACGEREHKHIKNHVDCVAV